MRNLQIATLLSLLCVTTAFSAPKDRIDPKGLKDKVAINIGAKGVIEFKQEGDLLSKPKVTENTDENKPRVTFQFTKADESLLLLKMQNYFPKALRYRAAVRAKGSEEFIETSVLPVAAGLSCYENLRAPIEELMLFDFSLTDGSEREKYFGVWGGKWDDKFPVFLTISKGDQVDDFKMTYSWLENTDDQKLSSSSGKGKLDGNHLNAKFLLLKLTNNKGMLYGTFGRMANLVPIKPAQIPAPGEADGILRGNGWTEGAIPAAEAKKQILAP